jgi:ankyrin repeat protein
MLSTTTTITAGSEIEDRYGLHRAKDEKTIKRLIAAGADVNAPYGCNPKLRPLHFARNVGIVKLLIAAGADVNAPCGYKRPLHFARSSGIAKLLIAAGADVNARDSSGKTPLFKARSSNIVKVLIAAGADVNALSKFTGQSPLLEHCERRCDIEILKLLVAAGADINATNNSGETPLRFFVNRGHDQEHVLRFFIDSGADIEQSLTYEGMDKVVARMLIDAGADVNARSDDGETPLLVHCRHNNIEMIQVLIDAGANTELKTITFSDDDYDDIGQTPLMRVFHVGYTGQMEYCIGDGDCDYTPSSTAKILVAASDIHARDCKGRTPLHFSVRVETTLLLIAAGADVNAQDHKGRTPLHYLRADFQEGEGCARTLIHWNADPWMVNALGQKPSICKGLEKFIETRRNHAARVIQKGCENWLWKPLCKDGTLGIRPRMLNNYCNAFQ